MVNIDYIMDLLDWNNSIKKQEKGIELAKNVKCINVFLQPGGRYYGKNVWDNCAKILSERSDDELSYYLIELLEWLQDTNWPGATCIFERIKRYSDDESFNFAYNYCIKRAHILNDEIWLNNLDDLKNNSLL